MASKTERPSDKFAIAATIDPGAHAAGVVNSDWVDMATFDELVATVMTGTLGTAATIDAKLQQATDAAGTGAKDITGRAITQIVKATGDNVQALINCWAEDLDVSNDFTHVRLALTVGTATSDCSAVILSSESRYGPDSDNDLASVAEIV